MFKIKNNLLLLNEFIVFAFLGFFLITSNNSVMAMTNNKGKKISINEPSNEEVNSFFKLLKSSKENIQKIKQKYPYLKNASSREIEEWALYGVIKQQQNQPKHINKKQKTIDLNTIPEEKE